MEKNEIVEVICDEINNLVGIEIKDIHEKVFFKSTLIDSLNMLNLILYLEQRYSLKIDAFFTDRESVESIDKLAEYIYSRITT